jgi:aminoglycoside phosphotransferase (APT) family kinase protein
VIRLSGGQHAATWRVNTAGPAMTVVVREFPAGDPAGASEEQVLKTLGGLGGKAPVVLSSDLTGEWSDRPTVLMSWVDGQADITPTDSRAWAVQLGRALATIHTIPTGSLAALPNVFDQSGGLPERLAGPAAVAVRSGWARMTADPSVLSHCDFWSGNVVWRDGVITGVVDWSGGALGPAGFDLGWCRLDLYLLYSDRIADTFLAAYEDSIGHRVPDVALWDSWAVARSHDAVETWPPNYEPLGRPDLGAAELRRRHSQWTQRLLDRL